MYGRFDAWQSNMMGWESHPWFGAGLGLIAVWSLVWKGLALWKSARNDQRYWFLALLVINTVGILEILYLFVFASKKLELVREAKIVTRSKKSSKK